jgi:hypothetical protein
LHDVPPCPLKSTDFHKIWHSDTQFCILWVFFLCFHEFFFNSFFQLFLIFFIFFASN